MPKTLKWQKTVAFSDAWPKVMPQVPTLDDSACETAPAAPPVAVLPLALPIVTEGSGMWSITPTEGLEAVASQTVCVRAEIRAPAHPQQSKMWMAGRSDRRRGAACA